MTSGPLSYNAFCAYKNVSRETFSGFEVFADLLLKWQQKINLISADTVTQLWERHIIDSYQMLDHVASAGRVLDMGSGAGFPGLILAIAGVPEVTLLESDGRKAAFLREAARVTGAGVVIENKRLEDMDISSYSTFIARGFAPLARLLGMIGNALKATSRVLLLKGKTYLDEVQEAKQAWRFDLETHPSITHADGIILSLTNIQPARTS